MWQCNACGGRRGGTSCKKWCREKYGDMGATQWPPLDGMVYINDDGTCIMGIDQYIYDLLPCKRDHHPKVNPWAEAQWLVRGSEGHQRESSAHHQ